MAVETYEEFEKLWRLRLLIDRGHWASGTFYREPNCQTWGACLIGLWYVVNDQNPRNASAESELARRLARILEMPSGRSVMHLNDNDGEERVRSAVVETLGKPLAKAA